MDIIQMPESFSSVKELEHWMSKFMFVTKDQRIVANDLSIETTGITIYNRYRIAKANFFHTSPEDSKEDPLNTISSNYVTEAAEDDITDTILHTDNSEQWEEAVLRARQMEGMGLIIMVDTESDPIPEIKLYLPKNLDILEEKWRRLQYLQTDKRILSNQTAASIFGINNDALYSTIKNFVVSRYEQIAAFGYDDEYDYLSKRGSLDLDPLEKAVIEQTYIERKESMPLSEQMKYERLLNIIRETDEDFCTKNNPDTSKMRPFFTPDEMEKFGVFSGEINLYAPKPDNDTIDNRISVSEWFKEYKNLYKLGLSESDDWYYTLKRLDEGLSLMKDKDEIAARKQSIIELGWNPEIKFNPTNFNTYRNQSIPRNIINLHRLYGNKFDKEYTPSLVDDIVYVVVDQSYNHRRIYISFDCISYYHIHMMYDKLQVEVDRINDIANRCNGTLSFFGFNSGYIHSNFRRYLRSLTQLHDHDINPASAINDVIIPILDNIDRSNDDEMSIYEKMYIMMHNVYNLDIKEINGYLLYHGVPDGFNPNLIKQIMTDVNKCEKLENTTVGFDTNLIFNYASKSIQELMQYDAIRDVFLNERVKDVRVNDEGDIVIKTVEDINTEFFKCHRNLMSYEKANNYEGMKDELCKLKYLDNFAVRKMKNKNHPNYKKYADAHARITNDFNKYLAIVTKHEPDFNFTKYYEESKWYDEEVVISTGLLERILEILGKVLRKH